MSESTALVKVGGVELPAAPIASIVEAAALFDRLAAQANFVTPIVRPDFIPPMHAVVPRVVRLDPTPDNGDVYVDAQFCKGGKKALTKVALLKLWTNAGGTLITAECGRTDDGKDRLYCAWKIVGEIQQMDGTRVRYIGTKEIDLNDGQPAALKALGRDNSTANLTNARMHIASNCETKAILRMVRAAFALKSTYTPEELAKPWVIPALVFQPDMSDPEVRRMVAARGLGQQAALYGTPAAKNLLTGPTAGAAAEADGGQPVRTVVAQVVDEEDDDQNADPWDDEPFVAPAAAAQPNPAKAAPIVPALPVSTDGMDPERARMVGRMNKVAEELLGRLGPNAGAAAINACAQGCDVRTAKLDDVAAVGNGLLAEIKRAKGGAR